MGTVLGVTRPAAASRAGDETAFTHVTVIDVTTGRRLPDQTVIVGAGRIAAVGPYVGTPVPATAEVIDLTGKFLIPGLCDMHVHNFGSEKIFPPLYLVAGVTTVREMWGMPFHHQWRDQVENGTLAGPRWVIGGMLIDGSPSYWNGRGLPFHEVKDEAEARAAVQRSKRDGADFVKVYSQLSRPLYRAVVDEARRQRIPFAGHCPNVVPVGEASDAGQSSFEHLLGMLFATSDRESEFLRAVADAAIDPVDPLRQMSALELRAVRHHHPRKAAAVFARLARNESRQVPTLAMFERIDMPQNVALDDERLKYLPASWRQIWNGTLTAIRRQRTPEESARRRRLFRHRLRLVAAMDRAGVPILAGTDGPGIPYLFPGFGLHDELAVLVRAGLSPLRALQAATVEPARYLGMGHDLGTVQRGKLADLVVLDADPLADITATRRVHSVVARGRYISPARRAAMLADIEAAAKDPAAQAPPFSGCGCHSAL
ncbi:amidohydrolase family protein [Nonomuraea antri]|uniref:amidohydrolase family protein n=1 Tax=Nonomuraea antri TaxID=2730852 RepID=UPI002E2B5F81|nr:amidohydrolase family protein [Nonomuraea antri]